MRKIKTIFFILLLVLLFFAILNPLYFFFDINKDKPLFRDVIIPVYAVPLDGNIKNQKVTKDQKVEYIRRIPGHEIVETTETKTDTFGKVTTSTIKSIKDLK